MDVDSSAAVHHSYNGFNQLVSSVTGEGTITYTYNAQGIRTSRTIGLTTTHYLLDGGNVIGEVTGDETYTYVRGINLIFGRARYYLYNAHGDVVQLTNTNGQLTKNYNYDAFGNERSPDEEDANPFRYCGEYYDTETGLYYLRARYYDPLIGRFTQEDTHWNTANMIYGDNPQKINEREDALGLKHYSYAPELLSILQAENLYLYCMSNPVLFADRWGSRAEFAATCIWQGCMGIEDLFIYGQRICIYAEDPYGAAKIKDVGCEIIATYNALVQIGKHADFNLIKKDFIFRDYIWLFGYFGSNPKKIDDYLESIGVNTATYKSKDSFENNLQDGSTFIISFWWNPVKYGIHTVMGVYSGGRYLIYNYSGTRTEAEPFDYLDEILDGGRFIQGILIEG